MPNVFLASPLWAVLDHLFPDRVWEINRPPCKDEFEIRFSDGGSFTVPAERVMAYTKEELANYVKQITSGYCSIETDSPVGGSPLRVYSRGRPVADQEKECRNFFTPGKSRHR